MKKESIFAVILGTLIGIAAGYAYLAALDHSLAERDTDGIAAAIIEEVK